ncbi:MAG: TIGR02646 family protein [Xanthomonadales bacterium]|jgi:uncharacterized protein (TIGR02646 family)|nr:TIGR02646 family protein [Xanthomonadales bacterium]
MRYVRKGTAPAAFEAWKAQANADWQPTYADLRQPEKPTLHLALIAEQDKVCCYCGRAITLADSHIEHFRPQEPYVTLELDYANLHASCIRETKPGDPLHCGHAKGNDFDETLAISPTEAGCEQRFLYFGTGGIGAADPNDAGARYMIALLKLDLPFLRGRRKEVLDRIYDPAFLETANDAELELLVQAFRHRQAEDFGHVIARYAEQLLGPAGSAR